MATIGAVEEHDKFIKPIHCLYHEYTTTIEQFMHGHSVLLVNHEIKDLGDDPSLKLYSEFSNEKDGELARELVQTWICDHRLEVTNCIHIALENRKYSFCNWFRVSEKFSSPDELMLYCLGKSNNLHVSIFNSSYVWSTLAGHIKYDYFEILTQSQIVLIFLGK